MQNKELAITIAAIHSRIIKSIDQKLSAHGISFSEFLVMYHLDRAPDLTMRRIDLAERVGLSASGVTRLINPMEKIGLVQKESNPRDARVSLVKLSEAGLQLFRDATVSFEMGAESALKALNEKQAARFLELAETLL
ncbi:MAG: MarR family transcriptional regulator [candidate division Zixibacteria bacterium]|nr:MarR family transcriptional regulator [candidate division Zixibacteria bacterium]